MSGAPPGGGAGARAALATPRLRLVPLSERDRSLYCAIYGDPVLMRHVDAPLSPAEADRSFALALAESTGRATGTSWWTATHRQARANVGVLGLRHAGDTAEIGVMLVAGWQGRGLAAEAIDVLLAAAFSRAGLARILMRHAPGNAPCMDVARALGFSHLEGEPDVAGRVTWQRLRP